MIRALLASTLTFCASAATAQDYDCQTRGYCTNALECSPDDERFEVRAQPDGTSTFGWVDNYLFRAKPLRRDTFTVWTDTGSTNALQTLTLSDNGRDATFSVILDIGGLYHSIQSLTCTPR